MKDNELLNNKNQIITQATIARVAGVSQQSVSQALNGTGRITDEVRQRVIDVANKLNYRPNKSALALRQKVHGTIGLIGLCNMAGSYISNTILQNLEIQLFNIHKYLTFIPVVPSEESEIIKKFPNFGIDGAFISLNREKASYLINAFQSAGIPEIWINSKSEFNCVYPDDYRGAFELTDFLITKGNRHIVYIGNARKPTDVFCHYSEVDRYQGYKDAMGKNNLIPANFLTDDLTTDLIRSIIKEKTDPEKTPVFLCYEWHLALRALLVAKEAGLHIPEELKIIYFHTQPQWEGNLDAMLRCLPIPNVQLAQAAIKMFEKKAMDPIKDTPSVAVPYDAVFFSHILTSDDYFGFNI